MKALGVFRESGPDVAPGLASIHDAAGKLESRAVARVAAYLRRGVAVFDIMEVTVDPFDRSNKFPGGSSLLSDGAWVWRDDLAFLVERYGIGLPSDFVRHALEAGGPSDRESVARAWQDALDAYERAERGAAEPPAPVGRGF